MSKLLWLLLVFSAFILAAHGLAGIRPSASSEDLIFVELPPGFSIEVFAEGLGGSVASTPGPNSGPRMMIIKDGVLYVTIPAQGKVVALPDADKDSKADSVETFLDGLQNPHGLAYENGWFYVAEEGRVIRFREAYGLKADEGSVETLVDLPTGGHFTRTVKVFNNSLFVSVGSSCNVCYEEDERRAAITKCDLDGKNCSPYATGLRNAVGFVFHENRIYATDNGRDWLGDDAPPDELVLIKEGKDYGWPICYGKNVHDGDFDKNVYIRDPCADKEPSLVDLQAHSAPLGLAVYTGAMFPKEYSGDIFIAYHGSWNRGEPTGYKIVSVDFATLETKDFAAGWLQNENVKGRPVDIIVDRDGSVFVSDDNAGKIYRISYGV